MKNKILVIGDGGSIFVKDFIAQYVKNGVVVDLITTTAEHVDGVNVQKKITMSSSSFRLKRFFHYICEFSKKLSELDGGYDAVIIHFISPFLAFHINQIRKMSNNLVGVVWGSDFYRIDSNLKISLQNYIYKRLDKVVFTSEQTKADFFQKKSFVNIDKMEVARFGLPVLQEIDVLSLVGQAEREQWYEDFGLCRDKINILVGYNANLAHQQIPVTKIITELPSEIIKKIHLVFPLGYGSGDTKAKIDDLLINYENVSYVILDKFYGFKDAAKLRMLTDILINVQPSDQFSGSMQETLYAGGYVLTGSWLPYQTLKTYKPKMEFVDSVEDIGDKLLLMLNENLKSSQENTENIKKYISSTSSWEVNIPIWDKILFPNGSSNEYS